MNERPICDICDLEVEGDHYYNVGGEVICENCMNEYFRRELEDDEDQDGADPLEDD